MLREQIYEHKKVRLWPTSLWARVIITFLLGLLFSVGIFYIVEQGSSKQLVKVLLDQRFPFDALILEGAPGYSQPARKHLDDVRLQGFSLGAFLLAGVNVSDARTFFLSYFTPPPQGPAWLSWAYHPNDPESEGPILEPLPQEQGVTIPRPDSEPPKMATKGILVGIYHTHTSENYSGDGGPDHINDGLGGVVKVGETLTKVLEKQGIGVVHSEKIHDYPDFMQAYSHSVLTAEKMLKDYPNLRILLDIHRDGLPPGVSKETVSVNGKDVAKVLIVIGKKNPHWLINEQMAKDLITMGNKKYPGLFVPQISYAADARYNQNLTDESLLVEFGSQLNTQDEANGAATAFGEILAAWIRTHQ